MFDVLGWVLIVAMAFSALAQIILIGQPRKPLTGGVVAFSVTANILFIGVIYGLIQGW